jgi:hypothetical protein
MSSVNLGSNLNKVSSGTVERNLLQAPRTDNVDVTKKPEVLGNNDGKGRLVTETVNKGPNVSQASVKENNQSSGQDRNETTNTLFKGNAIQQGSSIDDSAKKKAAAEVKQGEDGGKPKGSSDLSDKLQGAKGSPESNPNLPQQRPNFNPMALNNNPTMAREGRVSTGRRRGNDEDDEDENGQQRRRRKSANFGQLRQPPSIIEGAKVSESQSQDMFISSSHGSIPGGRNKSTVESLKEYNLGNIGNTVYETVIANTDHKEKNGIGQNMQKNMFTEILKGLTEVDDVLSPAYRKLVREVVQGSMRAAMENNVGLKDMAKMIVSGLMAMSPHDDDPQIMADTVKTIVSEIIYGKVNIGYNMKSASYYLGAALYTLTLYYKNYQSDVNFSKELEQKLSAAFSESIWKSTGEISNYSQVYAKTNIEQFMAGRVDEEKTYQKNVVKGMLLSPINKVLKRGT